MYPVQQNFQLIEISENFFLVTTGFENGYVREILLQISQYQFFFLRIYSYTDAVCMVLGKAVLCAFKIVTDMRLLESEQLPVPDLSESVQYFFLIRYEQKLVHPMTSEAFLELNTVTLYLMWLHYANELYYFKASFMTSSALFS